MFNSLYATKFICCAGIVHVLLISQATVLCLIYMHMHDTQRHVIPEVPDNECVHIPGKA